MLTCLNCGGMSDGSNFCCGACAADYEETEMKKITKLEIRLSADDVRTALEYWLTAEKDISEDALGNAMFDGLNDVIVSLEESEEE